MGKTAEDRVHADDLGEELKRLGRDTSRRLVSIKRDGESSIYIVKTERVEARMEYR